MKWGVSGIYTQERVGVSEESKTKNRLISENARLRERLATARASERASRRLEKASRKEKEALTSILENVPCGVGVCKGSFGRSIYQNPEFTRITGYGIEDLRDVRTWLLKAYPDRLYRRGVAEDWKHLRELDEKSKVLKVTCKDGEVKDVEIKSVPLADGLTVATFSDVSRRERAEAALREARQHLESLVEERTVELREANRQLTAQIETRKRTEKALQESREQLRNLSQHLQHAREEERKRIAREVHDELGQALSVLKIDAKFLGDAIGSADPDLRSQAQALADGLDSIVQMVRKICTELRPAILYHFGLAAAIEWQAKEIEKRAGLGCTLVLPTRDVALDHDLGTAVFRIFQEALTNVVRRSHATRVKVSLSVDNGVVVLRIKDNGKGVNEEDISSPRSLGISGMIERARFWNGRISFKGWPGKGTTVTLRVPAR
jgi:PAS domain S-box-containing protein